jgi:hypothetical protein
MKNEPTDRLALLNELTGLETVKRLIDSRIEELTFLLQPHNFSTPKTLKALPVGDPTVLGRDSLGRIKRKRNLSPEQRQSKRVLIEKARASRLTKIKESKKGL